MMTYEEINNLYDEIKGGLHEQCMQSSSDEHKEICSILMERYGDEIKSAVDDMYETLDELADDYSERLEEWFNVSNWMQDNLLQVLLDGE